MSLPKNLDDTKAQRYSSPPWHVPGKWFAAPAYWEPELVSNRKQPLRAVRFIDCTLQEGEDAVGCHLGWPKRLQITQALDELGVEEITVPGAADYHEQKDFIRWCKTHGIKASISAKGPGTRIPLDPGWKELYKRHIDLGGDSLVPIMSASTQAVFSDYSGKVSKERMVEAIQEVTAFAKGEGTKVIISIADSMRTRLDTAILLYRSAIQAGANGIYIWDSRGNSHPAATAYYVRRIREVIGDKPLYIQFHNDIGLAIGNCLMAVENGADRLDASILGVGDRGGCVAPEEAAVALALYGIDTGIKLEKLYQVCQLVEKAFGVTMHPWKPINGAAWPMEPGWGHWQAGVPPETPIGVNPEVVGRRFENVLAPVVFFGRYPSFITDMLKHWGYPYNEDDVTTIVERVKSSIMSPRNYITMEEFREICDGVLGIHSHPPS